MNPGTDNGKKAEAPARDGLNGRKENGSNGHTYSDSAATRRQEELAKKIGLETYARYPRELLEFRMDLPPKEPDPKDVVAWQKWDEKRRRWRPIHSPKVRIYATYMRYSWCWPICLEYAVVTDDRDEILRDHKGRPLVLSEEAVAEMHGFSKQRVSSIVLDLIADKLVRTEAKPGSGQGLGRTQAVFLEAKPLLTDEERCVKSTLVTTGVEGPRLEPAVLRRFSSLLNQLGEDDDLVTLPGVEWETLNAGSPNGNSHGIPVRDYRTLVWKQILDNRTVFLSSLKGLRYSERKVYRDTATRVRNLIDQRESSERRQSPAPAVVSAPAHSAAAAGSSNDAKTSPQPPTRGQNDHDERSGFGGYGAPPPDQRRDDYDGAPDPTAPILEAFKPLKGGITDSKARRLQRDCGGATTAEICAKTAEIIDETGSQRNINNRVALVIHKLMEFFHSPAALEMWRRDQENKAAQHEDELRLQEQSEERARRTTEEREEREKRIQTRIDAMPPGEYERLLTSELLQVRNEKPLLPRQTQQEMAESRVRSRIADAKGAYP